jgi:hypothetical protein
MREEGALERQKIARLQLEKYVPCMAFFYHINPRPETTHWPLRCSVLSAGRRDAAVWASRLRSGNLVWRHTCALHMGPSTGCQLAFAQVVAATAVRNFTPLCAPLAWPYSQLPAALPSSPSWFLVLGSCSWKLLSWGVAGCFVSYFRISWNVGCGTTSAESTPLPHRCLLWARGCVEVEAEAEEWKCRVRFGMCHGRQCGEAASEQERSPPPPPLPPLRPLAASHTLCLLVPPCSMTTWYVHHAYKLPL